jgi:hypothetical protein
MAVVVMTMTTTTTIIIMTITTMKLWKYNLIVMCDNIFKKLRNFYVIMLDKMSSVCGILH